jgi:hypothetical protein
LALAEAAIWVVAKKHFIGSNATRGCAKKVRKKGALEKYALSGLVDWFIKGLGEPWIINPGIIDSRTDLVKIDGDIRHTVARRCSV